MSWEKFTDFTKNTNKRIGDLEEFKNAVLTAITKMENKIENLENQIKDLKAINEKPIEEVKKKDGWFW